MKRAVILHGTDGKPDSNWFPWLKSKLEEQGYEVWVPQLPDAHVPNRQTWGDFILKSGFDLADGIVVGHSAGAVEVLNLLLDERMPHIRLGVMAGAWAGEVPDAYMQRLNAAGLQREQFLNLFPPQGFDFKLIISKADKLAFVHGSDDPFCPIDQAQYLARELNASFTVVPDGKHLSSNCTELPELWHIIVPNL